MVIAPCGWDYTLPYVYPGSPCVNTRRKAVPQEGKSQHLGIPSLLRAQTDFLSIPSPVRDGAPVRTRSHGDDVSALNGVPSAAAAAPGAHAEAVEARSKSETDLGGKPAAAQQPPPPDSVAVNPNDVRAVEREVRAMLLLPR